MATSCCDGMRLFGLVAMRPQDDLYIFRGGEGGRVLSVNRRGEILHFKFSDDRTYKMEGKSFEALEALITYFHGCGAKLGGKQGAEMLNPVYNTLPLIEYGRLQFLQELGRVSVCIFDQGRSGYNATFAIGEFRTSMASDVASGHRTIVDGRRRSCGKDPGRQYIRQREGGMHGRSAIDDDIGPREHRQAERVVVLEGRHRRDSAENAHRLAILQL